MRIAVSQRVDVIDSYGERRDALDQSWARLLANAGLQALPLPNTLPQPAEWCAGLDIGGVLLSGGNDLGVLAPQGVTNVAAERDATERAVIDWAVGSGVPVLGVCRGMQHLAHYFSASLVRVPPADHIARRHALKWSVASARLPWPSYDQVNSYHGFAVAAPLPAALRPVAASEEGLVEAFEHTSLAVAGLMWHPERSPHRAEDVDFLRQFYLSRKQP